MNLRFLAKMVCKIALLTMWIAMSWQPAGAKPFQAPPDDTARIPGFAPFAARLKQAVATRDADFIRSLLLQDTMAGYGPNDFVRQTNLEAAHSEARQKWARGLDDPQADFWKDMELYLPWGAEWSEAGQIASYPNFGDSPMNDRWLGDALVKGASVNVREAPSRSSKVLTTLSWEIISGGPKELRRSNDWSLVEHGRYYVKVRLPDGRMGYIHNDFILSDLCKRVGFQRVNGEWKLKWYASGE